MNQSQMVLISLAVMVGGCVSVGTAQAAKAATHATTIDEAASGLMSLIQAQRNPKAFQLASAEMASDTGAACFEYRGQNGFGGMNAGHAVVVNSHLYMTDFAGIEAHWNKYCTISIKHPDISKEVWKLIYDWTS